MNKILEEGLEKLGIEYSKEKIEKIEEFYLIFSEWNDKINLSSSSIQDSKDEFISRHILDSAGLLSYFPLGKMIGDLGSGGGFPGIVLKILNPLLQIELIEVIEKKITYLEDAIQRLGLSIPVRNPSKAKIGKKFDIMTCRAFGNLEKILTESKKYLKKPGKNNNQLNRLTNYIKKNLINKL